MNPQYRPQWDQPVIVQPAGGPPWYPCCHREMSFVATSVIFGMILMQILHWVRKRSGD